LIMNVVDEFMLVFLVVHYDLFCVVDEFILAYLLFGSERH
jgi:hypothetical protein